MPFLPIVYYGKPGLEADVFQAYMASSGYPVQMMTTAGGETLSDVFDSSSITVIALDKTPQELLQLAQEIRTQRPGCLKRVFILTEGQPPEVDLPSVEFIHRPYRLSELVERIRAVSRID